MLFFIFFVLIFKNTVAGDVAPSFCYKKDFCNSYDEKKLRKNAQEYFFKNVKKDTDKLCPYKVIYPVIDNDIKWNFKSRESEIVLGQGVSTFSGDLVFDIPENSFTAESSWVFRDKKNKVTNICLLDNIAWTHSFLKVKADKMWYRPESKGFKVCNIGYILYGGEDWDFWGWAHKGSSRDSNLLTLSKVQLSTCSPDDMVWSIKAKDLDWYEDDKKLVVHKASVYWYNWPLFYLGKASFVKGRQVDGWFFPAISFYADDGVQIVGKYVFPSNTDDSSYFSPIITTRLGLGLAGEDVKKSSNMKMKSNFKYMFRDYSKFKNNWAFYNKGERIFTDNAKLNWQLLRSSNGLFSQEFSDYLGSFFFRPNQDLTSYVMYDKNITKKVSMLIGFQNEQRFHGEKRLIDKYSLPNFDFIPLVRVVNDTKKGFIWSFQADNLRLLDKTEYSYPQVKRFLGYGAYGFDLKGLDVSFGSWFKARDLDGFWPGISDSYRSFIVPNVNVNGDIFNKDSHKGSFSYLYIKYVDQSNEPLFTTKNWVWQDSLLEDPLVSMDRIFDRNLFILKYRWDNFLTRKGMLFSYAHNLSIVSRKVSITDDFQYDPVAKYPFGVGVISLLDSKYKFSLDGIWVWPTSSFKAVDFRWRHRFGSFFWSRGPGEVIFKDDVYSMPLSTKLGALFSFDFTNRLGANVTLGYKSKLEKTLYYKLGFNYSSCCWSMGLSFRADKLRVDNDDITNIVFEKPKIDLNFKLKGF